MANIASAKKRARQSEVRRQRNASQRALLKTCIKKTIVAIDLKDKEVAASAYKAAVPIIDRMANKGLIHKNKASRHKNKLNKRLQEI